MVLQINQETFNDAVRENIEDLGLEPQEAVEEAVKQFESQGVDLSKVIKEIMTDKSEFQALAQSIQKLENLNKSKAAADVLCNVLTTIKTECDKGIQYRVFAGTANAYNVCLDALLKHTDGTVQNASLKALLSLMTKQPDLLDERGVRAIIDLLNNKSSDLEVTKLVLKWAKECCVMHEKNRQALFDANILESLKYLLMQVSAVDVLRDVLGAVRGLVLDDDVRVEFGRAHEHARVIASETLCLLTGLLSRFNTEELLVHDLMLTLTALLVRSEFCQKVEDAGGLKLIYDVMSNFSKSEKINKQCFKLLKALAGNDACKAHIIQKNLAPVISANLNIHKTRPSTASAGLLCVTALALRSPENSKALFEAGLPEVIVDAMRLNPNDKVLQKNASWAVRNMVSRSRNQTEKFLALGVEELLLALLGKFEDIEYDVKAALRDLGCKVHLNEEWTGKGGKLTSGFSTFKD